ncbi:DUF4429 domain-containing protein [Streptomyces litchfieldiae]|uniref:DUF4429 domain-containing protein n=1 Tax=Streptomyces litchfieldiae TaxID=3075543 RepID=A0ABU2MM66_9ACTN|nr:DUF4429 domain-containing protein [Streptomyces sp. DSM 44938]MDT0342585.1 DUF4429 domain-containing protein [Streptomyces sp. DSM 44938]
MAEITQPTGTWIFDGDVLRIVPGHGRGVHALRTALGEVTVPLEAMAGVSYEAGRKGGRLRLRLRGGVDPLTQATGGGLRDAADPYLLEVEKDRAGVAEYLADAVRDALVIEQVPDTPADRYLLPGPTVPLTLHASDGEMVFDGEEVRIAWGWAAEESKKSGGPRALALADLAAVTWSPPRLESGCLRLVPKAPHAPVKPAHDPNCVVLWGWRAARETAESALLAAAVTARLPHPLAAREAPALPAPAEPAALAAAPDHDTILRRLRELGELHRGGVLTDEEFSAAKKAMIDRL